MSPVKIKALQRHLAGEKNLPQIERMIRRLWTTALKVRPKDFPVKFQWTKIKYGRQVRSQWVSTAGCLWSIRLRPLSLAGFRSYFALELNFTKEDPWAGNNSGDRISNVGHRCLASQQRQHSKWCPKETGGRRKALVPLGCEPRSLILQPDALPFEPPQRTWL